MQKKLDILENKLYDDIVLGWFFSAADSEVSIPVQVVYEKSAPREKPVGVGQAGQGRGKARV